MGLLASLSPLIWHNERCVSWLAIPSRSVLSMLSLSKEDGPTAVPFSGTCDAVSIKTSFDNQFTQLRNVELRVPIWQGALGDGFDDPTGPVFPIARSAMVNGGGITQKKVTVSFKVWWSVLRLDVLCEIPLTLPPAG